MGGFESKPEDNMTEKERVKAYQKEVRKAISSIDRETKKLEAAEAKLKLQITAAGKANKTGELRTYVKDYLRTQQTIRKFYDMKTHLTGVQVTMVTTASTISLSEGLKNASSALREMNKRMNVPQMTAILRDFASGVGESEAIQEQMGVRRARRGARAPCARPPDFAHRAPPSLSPALRRRTPSTASWTAPTRARRRTP